jgi:hypothetical protein
LAGKSTLNRLELTPVGAGEKSRYKKVVARHRDIENFFVDTFLSLHSTPPQKSTLDFDATDDPIHGHQLGRFFHLRFPHIRYGKNYKIRGDMSHDKTRQDLVLCTVGARQQSEQTKRIAIQNVGGAVEK